MAFYLKPPRGRVPLHLLQQCVEERLKFFKSLSLDVPSTSLPSMEFLFEDSALDRAGHFTLRLGAVKDTDFKQLFIKYETLLFQRRLDMYSNVNVLDRLLVTFLRHTKECLRETKISNIILQFLKTCENVFTKMLNKNFQLHIFQEVHVEDNCKEFVIDVPFQHCLSLLNTYSFELIKGYLKITCLKWKKLLASLYNTYLHMAVKEMRYSSAVHEALTDTRIQLVLSLLSNHGYSNKPITLTNTKIEAAFFPLCIQNLQSILHRTHRLAHEERFNMSLFLKDVGMSVNDSISYWRSEYSQHTACTKCMHSWQQDEKRYIYSIKHLYGLEGSRRIYRSRSCSYFQQMLLTPREEGGCPFKHFDLEQLNLLISSTFKLCGVEYQNCDNIFAERLKNPSNACKLFFKVVYKALKKPETDCDIGFNSPVQYYSLMKSL